ncbi:MAG: hypothetical protein AAF206_30820 [Bacteroidota bacterium]
MRKLAPFETLLFVRIGLLLCCCLLVARQMQAQRFKRYYRSLDHTLPVEWSLHEIISDPGGQDVIMIGDMKGPPPLNVASAMVMRSNSNGEINFTQAIRTNFNTLFNGIRGSTVAVDPLGNYYLGGNSIQNRFGNGSGSERTITSMAPDGQLNWGRLQANHNFESIVFDPQSGSLFALSGQIGNTNPLTDMMINQIDQSGNFLAGTTLLTSGRDQAVKMILVNRKLLICGTHDLDDQPRIIVAMYDMNLQREWSYVYENQDFDFNVADLDWDGASAIGVSGTVSNALGEKEAFLLGLSDNGSPLFFYTYDMAGRFSLDGKSLSSFQANLSRYKRGFLLAGSYTPDHPNQIRSFLICTDPNGQINWANDYSNFSPWTDFTYEESIEDLVYLPGAEQFVAVGNFTRYLRSIPERKWVFQLRAGLENGWVDHDGDGCAREIQVQLSRHQISQQKLGADRMNTGSNGFGYQTETPSLRGTYCIFSPNKVGPITDLEEEYAPIPPKIPRLAQLFSLDGRRLHKQLLTADKERPDWGILPTGIYLEWIEGQTPKKIIINSQ